MKLCPKNIYHSQFQLFIELPINVSKISRMAGSKFEKLFPTNSGLRANTVNRRSNFADEKPAGFYIRKSFFIVNKLVVSIGEGKSRNSFSESFRGTFIKFEKLISAFAATSITSKKFPISTLFLNLCIQKYSFFFRYKHYIC